MTEQILRMFAERPQAYISGEELSRALQCSRTAIWKHIRRLRLQGYEFEATPRKGYRLVGKPNRLLVESILASLNTRVIGREIALFECLESTQTKAHERVAQGAPEGAVILAEQQTAGRGRMGKTWYSPSGKGIWMSMILKPQIPLPHAPQLTLLTAVSLCRAIKRMLNIDIGIKWPNDLLVGGKKVCGILLESSAEDERLRYVVAGIGISANLRREDYPEDLRDKATSLFMESGEIVDRERLIAAFLEEFEKMYELFQEQGFVPIRTLWEALSVSLNRPIRVQTREGWVEGRADSIDDYGALLVHTSDGGELKLYAGEVEHF